MNGGGFIYTLADGVSECLLMLCSMVGGMLALTRCQCAASLRNLIDWVVLWRVQSPHFAVSNVVEFMGLFH